MVDIDNRIYQRDFFLKPRAAQKSEKEYSNAQVISIDHTPIPAMPVFITYEVRDAGSGRVITGETDCLYTITTNG